MVFALVGNQNCGKTTLFNQLTGSNQHVGNFPGVTVDSKVGTVRSTKNASVVDLPGIYSIRPYTNEEIVTRDFILNEHPNGIINIADATNIERNLYLTLQLMEMKIPMVLALNMMDEVRGNGGSINVEKMSKLLGIPVIPISAAKNEGIEELISAALHVAENRIYPAVTDFCRLGPVHRCIHSVAHLVEDHADRAGISSRFAATKLIEGDNSILERLSLSQNEIETVEHCVLEMETEHGMDRNASLADMRYDFIESVCRSTVKKSGESKERKRSEKIDSILTNKFAAIPIFVGIMLLVFWLTFDVIGGYFQGLLEAAVEYITELSSAALISYGINPVAHSLIIDGLFSGVGSVLSFLPLIIVLFFFLSILEDSGYMARVAFVTDKLLRKIGLSGRSIVPMLIGFGCSVPAIMATRTLSSERDRKLTVLLIPFMSCSAKIPIYAFFTTAFFSQHKALVMGALYFGGIIVGILCALIAGKALFRGTPMPFVMELPNYRFPSVKTVALLMWDKAKEFIKKAFTTILVATVIIWFLESFDMRLNFVESSADSLLASIGQLLTPLFTPLGFSDWRIPTALITGLTAKEAVVSTINILLGGELLIALFTPLTAASFLTFTLLYTPCIAAIATLKKEFKSVGGTLFVVLFQCVVAWICAFAVYNIGLLL